MEEEKEEKKGLREQELTLVIRKPCFGLPTACPSCLPVYFYLKFSQIPFNLSFNLIYPDSDQLPYVESGTYVAYANEKGGLVESLKEDGTVDLDSEFLSNPEWVSTKAMVDSWLADALLYELWLGTDWNIVHKIYYSDLPWPIGKILYFKKIFNVKQLLGITKENAERREKEIYNKAAMAYGALSTRLGEQTFLFENRPSSLDALFLAHALLTLQALPDTSELQSKFQEHDNLVKYAESLKTQFIDAACSSSSHGSPSPSASRTSSYWSWKPKSRPKREKTEEEKKFKRRAKYFLTAQLVSVLVFLSLFNGSSETEVEVDDDQDGFDYD